MNIWTKFTALSMFAVAFFSMILCTAPPSFANEASQLCKAKLEKQIRFIKEAHRLVTLDVRVVDLSEDPPTFRIDVKTFPAAYLSGYYAFGDVPPNPVVYAEKISELFELTKWQPLVLERGLLGGFLSEMFPDGKCVCQKFPREWKEQMAALDWAMVTWYNWRQSTSYWDAFDTSLDRYFQKAFETIADQFVAESTANNKRNLDERLLVIPYAKIHTLETFTDDLDNTLEFKIRAAVVVWDGNGRTKEYIDMLLDGMDRGFYPNTSVTFKFQIDVGAPKSREKISAELDQLAYRYGSGAAYVLGEMVAHRYGLKEPVPPSQFSVQPKPKPAPIIPPVPAQPLLPRGKEFSI